MKQTHITERVLVKAKPQILTVGFITLQVNKALLASTILQVKVISGNVLRVVFHFLSL